MFKQQKKPVPIPCKTQKQNFSHYFIECERVQERVQKSATKSTKECDRECRIVRNSAKLVKGVQKRTKEL